MVYIPTTGQVLLFGGENSTDGAQNDTWTFNGSTWTQLTPATSPPARYSPAMVYDPATGNVVLFGGLNASSGAFGDTWTWNGTTWTQQSPATSPSKRGLTTMVYDTALGKVVLFGGNNEDADLADTWTWDGTTWAQLSPATSPSARYGEALAYDPASSQLLLFGGDATNTYVNDTWTFSGTTWTQLSPAVSPSARSTTSTAYDPATGQVLLFGGYTTTGRQADTWIWNGTTWTQQSPANSPPSRSVAPMVYNPVTQQVVMFGGRGSSFLNDTWFYGVAADLLPTTAVGTAAAQTAIPFVIGNTSGSLPALSNANVLTLGASGLDLTLGSGSTCTGTVTAGETCTVNVAFTPSAPGLRVGVVNLLGAGGNVLATAFVDGIGTGPLATFTPGTVSTVAGIGTECTTSASSGCADNGAATSAQLAFAQGAVVDGAGNIYIADTSDNRIRKVTAATGVITTIAGNGNAGYSGDNGAAISAALNTPLGVGVDGGGNVYIADASNNRIRKIAAATGIITTVAGNGTGGFAGDNGLATSGELSAPEAVSVDGAGNLYIADASNQRIREVNAATGFITTVAGNGTACTTSATTGCADGGPAISGKLNDPSGIAVDASGNLYIADANNQRIRMVSAATGTISTVAGAGSGGYSGDSGLATSATLNEPLNVAVDAAGNFYVADSGNNVVREVMAASGFIRTVAGTGAAGVGVDGGPATTSPFNGTTDVALDSAGNLYIADVYEMRIRKVTATAATVGFADTSLGSTSATQTFAINNAGNVALTYPIPAVGSTNPVVGPAFNLVNSSTCPELTSSATSAGTLAAGASCTYVANYEPTVSGAIAQFLTPTDNSLNVTNTTQNIALTGSTGGLNVVVQNTTATHGSTAVALSFSVGYGGNTLPIGTPTLTVNGSATAVGTIMCKAKAGHNACTATYNASGLAKGQYQIAATQPADSTYSQTKGMGTLTIQ